jgi:CheY-like chemotaxis protein
MVVEDDRDIREAVQMILEDEGYDVVTACNGAEAEAELAKMDDPCLVLLDLMMPVMSGWELLDHLKRDGKLRAGRLQVVVVSASLHQVPSGPVATMRKPVHVEQLISTVRRYC